MLLWKITEAASVRYILPGMKLYQIIQLFLIAGGVEILHAVRRSFKMFQEMTYKCSQSVLWGLWLEERRCMELYSTYTGVKSLCWVLSPAWGAFKPPWKTLNLDWFTLPDDGNLPREESCFCLGESDAVAMSHRAWGRHECVALWLIAPKGRKTNYLVCQSHGGVFKVFCLGSVLKYRRLTEKLTWFPLQD